MRGREQQRADHDRRPLPAWPAVEWEQAHQVVAEQQFFGNRREQDQGGAQQGDLAGGEVVEEVHQEAFAGDVEQVHPCGAKAVDDHDGAKAIQVRAQELLAHDHFAQALFAMLQVQ
ncbi:hypothetical protein D3C76_1213570 [compost metagenome]